MSTRSTRASCARDVALFRYSLIRPLADPTLTAAERGLLVRELARGVHVGPAGEAVRVSRSTLDRWIRAWRGGGFDALIPPVRQVHPRTAADALELAARLKRERPARTAAHIARIVETSQGWAPSARTLQRHFVRLQLGRRPDGTQAGVFGRFEADKPSAYSSGQLAWSAAVLDIRITHSRPGRPQGRGKIERWNRTCRDQFLVEIEVANTGGGSACSSLADLNRLFTAWLHQLPPGAAFRDRPNPGAAIPPQRRGGAPPARPRTATAGVSVARAAHRLRGRDRGSA